MKLGHFRVIHDQTRRALDLKSATNEDEHTHDTDESPGNTGPGERQPHSPKHGDRWHEPSTAELKWELISSRKRHGSSKGRWLR